VLFTLYDEFSLGDYDEQKFANSVRVEANWQVRQANLATKIQCVRVSYDSNGMHISLLADRYSAGKATYEAATMLESRVQNGEFSVKRVGYANLVAPAAAWSWADSDLTAFFTTQALAAPNKVTTVPANTSNTVAGTAVPTTTTTTSIAATDTGASSSKMTTQQVSIIVTVVVCLVILFLILLYAVTMRRPTTKRIDYGVANAGFAGGYQQRVYADAFVRQAEPVSYQSGVTQQHYVASNELSPGARILLQNYDFVGNMDAAAPSPPAVPVASLDGVVEATHRPGLWTADPNLQMIGAATAGDLQYSTPLDIDDDKESTTSDRLSPTSLPLRHGRPRSSLPNILMLPHEQELLRSLSLSMSPDALDAPGADAAQHQYFDVSETVDAAPEPAYAASEVGYAASVTSSRHFYPAGPSSVMAALTNANVRAASTAGSDVESPPPREDDGLSIAASVH